MVVKEDEPATHYNRSCPERGSARREWLDPGAKVRTPLHTAPTVTPPAHTHTQGTHQCIPTIKQRDTRGVEYHIFYTRSQNKVTYAHTNINTALETLEGHSAFKKKRTHTAGQDEG